MSICTGPSIFEGTCVRGRETRIIDCISCGFAHVDPRPTEEELAEYYKEKYFGDEKPDYSAEHHTIDKYWRQVYSEQWTAMGRDRIVQNRKLLDVGCGRDPVWLRYALENGLVHPGFYVIGIEPSLEQAADCGRIRIFPSWEEFGRDDLSSCCEGAHFDVINLGFVLEHARNPFDVLSKCKMYMRDYRATGTTFLLVEVPWDFNPIQKQASLCAGKDGWWVSTPDHINYFNPKSLENLLTRCGLQVCSMRTTYPVELFRLHGEDYSQDEKARARLNERRAELQEFWWTSGMSEWTHIGRTVWAIATLQ